MQHDADRESKVFDVLGAYITNEVEQNFTSIRAIGANEPSPYTRDETLTSPLGALALMTGWMCNKHSERDRAIARCMLLAMLTCWVPPEGIEEVVEASIEWGLHLTAFSF